MNIISKERKKCNWYGSWRFSNEGENLVRMCVALNGSPLDSTNEFAITRTYVRKTTGRFQKIDIFFYFFQPQNWLRVLSLASERHSYIFFLTTFECEDMM